VQKPPNRVRIIGGRHRGRVVRFPPEPGLRPTPDRVRETLFNWLGQRLDGRTTLELFAGTGVLSLESLSRGAARAVAIDRNPRLVRALAASAREIGVEGLEVQAADAQGWLARDAGRYDVVFLDPPFDSDPWQWLLPAAAAHLAAGGRIYAEAGSPLEAPAGLTVVRRDKAGHVHYHLLAPTDADGDRGPP
jgi:16S rRNA (guanine966-N2)-methyltransferase